MRRLRAADRAHARACGRPRDRPGQPHHPPADAALGGRGRRAATSWPGSWPASATASSRSTPTGSPPPTACARPSSCAASPSPASPPPTSCCWRSRSGPVTPPAWGDATRTLLHWFEALIALPAIAYAAQPFFGSALQRAPRRPHQHGRADLAGGDPGPGHEPVGDHPRRPARLFRQRHHAAVLPPGRPLSRPARPRQRPLRRRAPAGAGRHRRHLVLPDGTTAQRAPDRASRPGRRCWSRPASGSASTAPCSPARARSTPA